MKIQKPKKIILIVLFVLLFFYGLVFAQEKKEVRLFVGPSVFNLEFEKGEIYNGRFLLWSKNNFELNVNSHLINFNAKDEVGGINYKKGKGTEWFSGQNSRIILKPNERKIIKFKIKIPENTPRGGYYVSWIFTPKFKEKETNAKLVPRISSLFLISVGKKEKANFKIIEQGVPKGARYPFLEKIFKKEIILNNASFPSIFRVKNNDIYHTRPQGTLAVLKGEKIIGKVSTGETTILPKKIRKISVNFKPSSGFLSNFYFGEYNIVLKLREGGFIQKSEKEVFILPWKGVLLIKILLISILLYFIIVKYKKRNKRKIASRENKKKTNKKVNKNSTNLIPKVQRKKTKPKMKKVSRKIIDTKKRKR